LEPVVVGSFTERRDGEYQQHQKAAGADGQRLRQWLDEIPAPPARNMEAVHEGREALIKFARPGLCLVHPEIDARIEIEQEAAQPRLPAVRVVTTGEDVTQGSLRTTE